MYHLPGYDEYTSSVTCDVGRMHWRHPATNTPIGLE
jgi:hypothetical protein